MTFTPIDYNDQKVVTTNDIIDFIALRRYTIAVVASSTIAASLFLTYYLLTPTYEASASLMIDASQVRPVIEAAPPSDFEKVITFQTQIDVIKSAGLATQVVQDLDLGRRRVKSRIELITDWFRAQQRTIGFLFDIKSWQKAQDETAASVSAVMTNTNVEAKPQSVVIKISYTAHDAREASETVNVLVSEYIKSFNLRLKERASGVVEYLRTQLDDVGKKLVNAEQAMLSFEESDRFPLGPGGGNSTIASAPGTVGRNADISPGLVGVTDSGKVQEEMKILILSMDEELRKLQIQYPATYPAVIDLKTKIGHYVAALNNLPQREVQHNRLTRQLEFEQETYKYLQQNLERSRVVQVSNTGMIGLITILEKAEPNDRAIAPKARLIIPGGIIFGILFGIAIAAMKNYFDIRIYSEHSAASSLRLPILGSLPRI